MDINEGMEHLRQMYKDKEWYHSVGQDQHDRLVVYINYATIENLSEIPDRVAGKQVLTHFASSLSLDKDKYVNRVNTSILPMMELEGLARRADADGSVDEDINFQTEELSLRHLENELDRLEKACGSNTLQDIFYEIKDAHNAVTNLSARYPDVRHALEKLYDQYGFDVIYENLDG
jgi:hypothetical protein